MKKFEVSIFKAIDNGKCQETFTLNAENEIDLFCNKLGEPRQNVSHFQNGKYWECDIEKTLHNIFSPRQYYVVFE